MYNINGAYVYTNQSVVVLYVGLVHAAPPTQYKAFTSFSTNWLSEGSTLTYVHLQGAADFKARITSQ